MHGIESLGLTLPNTTPGNNQNTASPSAPPAAGAGASQIAQLNARIVAPDGRVRALDAMVKHQQSPISILQQAVRGRIPTNPTHPPDSGA